MYEPWHCHTAHHCRRCPRLPRSISSAIEHLWWCSAILEGALDWKPVERNTNIGDFASKTCMIEKKRCQSWLLMALPACRRLTLQSVLGVHEKICQWCLAGYMLNSLMFDPTACSHKFSRLVYQFTLKHCMLGTLAPLRSLKILVFTAQTLSLQASGEIPATKLPPGSNATAAILLGSSFSVSCNLQWMSKFATCMPSIYLFLRG